MSLIYVKPRKEYAYRRRAIKRHTCKECHRLIVVGDHYVEDHVSHVKRNKVGQGYLWWKTQKICEYCWKAPLNV